MTGFSRRTVSGAATMVRPLTGLGDPVSAIASAAVAVGVLALALGGSTMLLRRIGGGFAVPPSIVLPWLVVIFGAAMTTAADIGIRTGVSGRWAGIVGRVGLVIAVISLVPFGITTGGLVAAFIPLAVAAAVVLAPTPGVFLRLQPGNRFGKMPQPELPQRTGSGFETTIPSLSAPLPAGFRQRLERFHSANDGDRAIGRVLVDVLEGSRTGHAHLGFCPPFAAMPTVVVTSDDDGVEAVVTAAEVVPWGVRVECRLSEPAEEPLTIPVDVVARYPG